MKIFSLDFLNLLKSSLKYGFGLKNLMYVFFGGFNLSEKAFRHSVETINPFDEAFKYLEQVIKHFDKAINRLEETINQSEEAIKYNLLHFNNLRYF